MAQDDKSEKPSTEFSRTMAGAAQTAARDIGDIVKDAGEDVGDAIKRTGRAVGDQGEAVVEWIKARPLTSVAIGAAVAAVIGVYIGRKIG